MGEWTRMTGAFIEVLIRLAGVVLIVGLAWNFTQIIIESASGGGGVGRAGVVSRVVGLVAGFLMVAGAPTVVNALQGMLRTQVVP